MAESLTSSFFSGAGGGATVAIVIKAYDEYSKELEKAGAASVSTGKKAAASYAAIGAAAGAAAIGVYNLSVQASRAEKVQESFNRLIDDGSGALQAMRVASHGAISDVDLMRNANLLLQNVQGTTVEQLTAIANASVVLGQAVGIDAVEAYNRLAAGIAKGETELLDELGLKLDATVAYRKYAESIGKSTIELTAQERATAAMINILPQLEERTRALGGVTDNAALAQSRLAAAFENAKNKVGAKSAPFVETVTGGAADFIDFFFLSSQEKFDKKMSEARERAKKQYADINQGVQTTTDSASQYSAEVSRVNELLQEELAKRESSKQALFVQWLAEQGKTVENQKQLDLYRQQYEEQLKITEQMDKQSKLFTKLREGSSYLKGMSDDELTKTVYSKKKPIGSNIKFNDFLMRPGSAPVSFSSEDTIIGVKDTSKLGGKTVNVFIDSVQGLNPDAVATALEKKVLKSIVL